MIELRYIQNRDEQLKILHACHTDATAGHMGIKRTTACISERFVWNGVVKDVKEMVSEPIFLQFKYNKTALQDMNHLISALPFNSADISL